MTKKPSQKPIHKCLATNLCYKIVSCSQPWYKDDNISWGVHCKALVGGLVYSPHISARTPKYRATMYPTYNKTNRMYNRWMMRQPKVYHPRQADCTALRIYDPDQPNLYSPRLVDLQLSAQGWNVPDEATWWVLYKTGWLMYSPPDLHPQLMPIHRQTTV